MLAMFIFMVIIEAAMLPIFAVFFDFSAFSATLLVVIVLATLGFAAVGTLFAAVAANVRSREIMLPILFFPLVSPVIIGAVETSGAAIGGSGAVVSTGALVAAYCRIRRRLPGGMSLAFQYRGRGVGFMDFVKQKARLWKWHQ